MTPNQKEFLKYSKNIAKKNKIKFLFLDVHTIKGMKCTGYFDSEIPELAVAIKRPFDLWFQVFIHETCHMDQFLENSRYWNSSIKKKYDSLNLYDLYVDHVIELKDDIQIQVLESCIGVELDCEKRAVKKIDEFDLEFDTDQYIKEANLYCYSYSFCFKERKWASIRKIVRNNPNIYDYIPDVFLKKSKDYIDIPKDLYYELKKGIGNESF